MDMEDINQSYQRIRELSRLFSFGFIIIIGILFLLRSVLVQIAGEDVSILVTCTAAGILVPTTTIWAIRGIFRERRKKGQITSSNETQMVKH